MSEEMITITIDDEEIETPAGTTVLDAALDAGVCIPNLCYLPKTAALGACRVCLVELEQNGKSHMTASCTLEAKDGMEALEKAKELGTDLDLVISDVVMPRINGPELLESLSELNSHVKVVFITGYAGDDMIAGQLPEGYRLLLEKPFGSADLLAMIAKTLRSED